MARDSRVGKTHTEQIAAAHDSVAPWAEEAIRRDERLILARLLEEHGEAITTYTRDESATLKLVVYMLRLDGQATMKGAGEVSTDDAEG